MGGNNGKIRCSNQNDGDQCGPSHVAAEGGADLVERFANIRALGIGKQIERSAPDFALRGEHKENQKRKKGPQQHDGIQGAQPAKQQAADGGRTFHAERRLAAVAGSNFGNLALESDGHLRRDRHGLRQRARGRVVGRRVPPRVPCADEKDIGTSLEPRAAGAEPADGEADAPVRLFARSGDLVLGLLDTVRDPGDAVEVPPGPLAQAGETGRVGWIGQTRREILLYCQACYAEIFCCKVPPRCSPPRPGSRTGIQGQSPISCRL